MPLRLGTRCSKQAGGVAHRQFGEAPEGECDPLKNHLDEGGGKGVSPATVKAERTRPMPVVALFVVFVWIPVSVPPASGSLTLDDYPRVGHLPFAA